MEMKQIKSS